MHLFETIIYQPFFNILIWFYHLLELIPGVEPDMGVAVIFFTITLRIILLPTTIASTRTKTERKEIQDAVMKAQEKSYSAPEKSKSNIRKIFKANRRVVLSEGVNFIIQLLIFFILYRIFTTGLEGDDLHLIYPFMPKIDLPFNLMFLGIFDLSHPSWTLNLIQSFVIFVVEVLSLVNSPFPVSRHEFVRYVVILPVASFLIFMFLPAGKKIFIITTLLFSMAYLLIQILTRVFQRFFDKLDQKSLDKISNLPQAVSPQSEKQSKLE